MPDGNTATIATVIEYLLIAVGLVLLWRLVLSPASRRRRSESAPRLAPWNASPPDFLFFILAIVGAGLVGSFAVGLVVSRFSLSPDAKAILASAAFQLGLLIAPALLPLQLGHSALRPPFSREELRSGLVTFLIALPVVTATTLLWLGVLKITGLPAEQQDLLRMFSHADSGAMLGLLVVLATVVAPMSEELLFRATIFRYLRTRTPKWFALLAPGVLFASLHVNWTNLDGLASLLPLVMLAVIFSLAYERTGKIGTPMIAHALFNVNTIVLLLAGAAS